VRRTFDLSDVPLLAATLLSCSNCKLNCSKDSYDPMHPAQEPEQLRQAARCGAKTRSGAPCRSPAVTGKRRCRMHGGAKGSGGPKGLGNGNYKHGRYTAEAIASRRWLRQFIRDLRALVSPKLRSTSNAACIQVFAISNNIWRCLSDLVSAAPRKQSCAKSRYALGDAAMARIFSEFGSA
jgi:hypothetical protein